jgi:hypothetical protein
VDDICKLQEGQDFVSSFPSRASAAAKSEPVSVQKVRFVQHPRFSTPGAIALAVLVPGHNNV